MRLIYLENARVGGLVILNDRELLDRDCGVHETCINKVLCYKLLQRLRIELRLQLLQNVCKLCTMNSARIVFMPRILHLRRTRTSAGFAVRLTGAAETSMGAKRAEARVAEKRMAN